MVIQTRKRLLPIEAIMLVQMIVYTVILLLVTGYAYNELIKAGSVFDVTHKETKTTLEEVQSALKNRIRVHTELLEINHSIKSFESEFNLLTFDPERTDDKVIQIIQELTDHTEHLKGFSHVLSAEKLDSLLENISIVLDVADELLITPGFNYRYQLFRDTVDPIVELSLSIDHTTHQFADENNKLSDKLVTRMEKADTDLSDFNNHTSKLGNLILLSAISVLLIAVAMQIIFFRNLRSRLIMLAEYADDIAHEVVRPPPFKSRDKTGHLAVHLALMGRRIRHLLKISREENKRADNALKEVEKLAYYDPLTGLENRRLFNEHLNDAFELSKRYANNAILFFLDLDNFKNINDSMGHDIGDELLKELANRLKHILRSSDHLARLGGDEFGIIAFHQPDNGVRLVQRINESLRQPVIINDQEIEITVSVGITDVESENISVSDLMRRADLAMYQAKAEGRDTYKYFSRTMQDRADQQMDLTRELRNAIKHQQLQLFYQPQIDLISGTIKGAEALIRWIHPERGMIPPDIFIPVAEETGLISEIGDWVIDTACTDAASYLAQRQPITVAVNVSARQFYGRSLSKYINNILQNTQLSPGFFEIEITEGILLDDIDHAISVLKQIRDLGVRISLDDFGTGYSSLSYLKQLPIDVLKIDRSFISNMLEHRKDGAIVKTIIELAHHMDLTVVAEGIETEQEASFLREHRCHFGQGYLFARPAPFENLLAATEQDSQIFQFNHHQTVNQ